MTEVVVPLHLPAYLVLVTLVVVTPGPDVVLLVRNTLGGGRGAGAVTGLGMASSLLVQGCVAGLGTAELVRQSAVAFTVLKFTGAGYLCWLGTQALWAAWRNRAGIVVERPSRFVRRSYRQGFLSNAGNPKVLVFYLAVLAQFVDPRYPVLPQAILLAGVHVVVGMAWVVVVVLVTERLRWWIETPGTRRAFEAATGAVLIGLGVRLLFT